MLPTLQSTKAKSQNVAPRPDCWCHIGKPASQPLLRGVVQAFHTPMVVINSIHVFVIILTNPPQRATQQVPRRKGSQRDASALACSTLRYADLEACPHFSNRSSAPHVAAHSSHSNAATKCYIGSQHCPVLLHCSLSKHLLSARTKKNPAALWILARKRQTCPAFCCL